MKTTPAPLCAARAFVPCNHSGDSMKFFDPGRFLIGGIFLAFGLFMLHQTVIFECSFTPEPFSLHPMDFPRAVLVLWCLLAVIYIVAPREPVVFIPPSEACCPATAQDGSSHHLLHSHPSPCRFRSFRNPHAAHDLLCAGLPKLPKGNPHCGIFHRTDLGHFCASSSNTSAALCPDVRRGYGCRSIDA